MPMEVRASMPWSICFALVGQLVVSTWAPPLELVGDVVFLVRAHVAMREFLPESAPPWVIHFLFWVAHQLRYSALIHEFLAFARDAASEWVGTDYAVEALVRAFMISCVSKLQPLWARLQQKGHSAQFDLEKAMVPSQVLKHVGLAKKSLASWDWRILPIRRIGDIFACASQLPAAASELAHANHFKLVYERLEKISQPGVGRYGITHKIRCLMMALPGRAAEVKGWFGGDTMSTENASMHQDLGSPSVAEFRSLLSPDPAPTAMRGMDVEAGFHMCMIGEVARAFAPNRTEVEISSGLRTIPPPHLTHGTKPLEFSPESVWLVWLVWLIWCLFCLVWLVCLVWFVSLVWLVWLVLRVWLV